MNIGKYRKVLLMLAAAALMFVYGAAEAHANWGSFGSRGGSSGGSRGFASSGGSSGGSWGGSRGRHFGGSSGGGLFARHRAKKIARHGSSGGSSGGSYGSRGYASRGRGSSGGSMGSSGGRWGSSGGSRGYSTYSYYSSSSGGSRGYTRSGYGSSGGQYVPVYTQPIYSQPVYNTAPTYSSPIQSLQTPVDGTTVPQIQPTPAAPIEGGATPPPGPERTGTDADPTTNGDDTAMLNLQVPIKAVVYVNGRRTTTPGSFRRYVSRNLTPGKNYTYEVKAEIERDGKMLTRTKMVSLTAGASKTFDMDFVETKDPITSVTLFVPEDAKVSLGGVETKASGSMRYFSTSRLKDGDSWSSYLVVVTVERDGKQVKRQRVIDVNAGDSVNLRFDFDTVDQVATR